MKTFPRGRTIRARIVSRPMTKASQCMEMLKTMPNRLSITTSTGVQLPILGHTAVTLVCPE